eukprot:680359-Amphidinium_carterae.1
MSPLMKNPLEEDPDDAGNVRSSVRIGGILLRARSRSSEYSKSGNNTKKSQPMILMSKKRRCNRSLRSTLKVELINHRTSGGP